MSKHSATIARPQKRVTLEGATITDCGDYFRVQWDDEAGGSASTFSKASFKTMQAMVSLVRYLLSI